jgi:hypothetical protein
MVIKLDNPKLPYIIGFVCFGIFSFLGLVTDSVYSDLLEAIFVYSMYFLFVIIICGGCYGHCRGWSDESCPRHGKKKKKQKKLNSFKDEIFNLKSKRSSSVEEEEIEVESIGIFTSIKNVCLLCMPSFMRKKFHIHPDPGHEIPLHSRLPTTPPQRRLSHKKSIKDGSFERVRELKFGHRNRKYNEGCLKDFGDFKEFCIECWNEFRAFFWPAPSTVVPAIDEEMGENDTQRDDANAKKTDIKSKSASSPSSQSSPTTSATLTSTSAVPSAMPSVSSSSTTSPPPSLAQTSSASASTSNAPSEVVVDLTTESSSVDTIDADVATPLVPLTPTQTNKKGGEDDGSETTLELPTLSEIEM